MPREAIERLGPDIDFASKLVQDASPQARLFGLFQARPIGEFGTSVHELIEPFLNDCGVLVELTVPAAGKTLMVLLRVDRATERTPLEISGGKASAVILVRSGSQ